MTAREVQARIIEEIQKQGLSSTELAERADLAQPHVGLYLNAEPVAVTPIAFKLIEALGLELVVKPKGE